MRTSRMAVVLACVVVGLIGCASGPQLMWSKPGVSQQDFAQDKYKCERASVEQYTYNMERDPACDRPPTGIGDAIGAIGRICGGWGGSGTRVNGQLFQSCMEAQGWRLGPQAESGTNLREFSEASLLTYQADLKASVQKYLSGDDRSAPKTSPCASGWDASQSGYVVATATWAEEAGLSLGDKIVAIGGIPVTNREERARAYHQVPMGGPLVLSVIRQGQPITLSVSCRYLPDRDRAERRAHEAASRGDWDVCITAVRETRRLDGFATASTVSLEHECLRAKNPLVASGEWRNLAALYYEWARLRLREIRYVPGETENVRGAVLGVADGLRRMGFPAYANDLEAQLREVLAAPPGGPPSRR